MQIRRPQVLTVSSALAQGRPALVFGDAVYVRTAADAQGAEYCAAVVAVEAARVFLAVPSVFWTAACKASVHCYWKDAFCHM